MSASDRRSDTVGAPAAEPAGQSSSAEPLRVVALVVAGGEGARLARAGGKQMTLIAGAPVLTHTIRAFEQCAAVDAIVVVAHPDRVTEYERRAIDPYGFRKVVAVVGGGSSRDVSVRHGLAAVPPGAGFIAVHDGARPLITPESIESAVAALDGDPRLAGVVVGHPAYDTLKWVDSSGAITGTPDRSLLWLAQTPQIFRAAPLREAYEQAQRDGFAGTDDASLVERAGGAVRMVMGPRDNIKITVPEDVRFAEQVLAARNERRLR